MKFQMGEPLEREVQCLFKTKRLSMISTGVGTLKGEKLVSDFWISWHCKKENCIPVQAFKRNNSMMGSPKHRGPWWCSVCEVECNSRKHHEDHCEGKKHKRRLEEEEVLAFRKNKNEKQIQQPGTENIEENLKKDNKNNMHIPSVSIQTNAEEKQNDLSDSKSQADQEQTVSGKTKHPDKNQNPGGEADAKASVSNQGKRKEKAKATDNLDTKRQRLLDAGTPISELKECPLCNVVCNSQIIFNKHLDSKKHKKKEEAANAVSQGNKVCTLCNVDCQSQIDFNAHLAGKKHKKAEEVANAVLHGNKAVEEANVVTAGNEIKEEAAADSERNTTEEEASANECTADGEDEKTD